MARFSRRSVHPEHGLERQRGGRTNVAATVGALLVLVSLAPIGSGARVDAATAPIIASAPIVAESTLPAPLPASKFAHRLSSEVYGYLPYWEIDAGTDAYLRYDLLSDIALFSVAVSSTGTLDTGARGYGTVTGSTAATIVQHAHAAGVRVDLTFTSFGLSKNTAFFGSASAQATAIAALAGLVKSEGLDGVAVDVELLANTDFAAYGVFVGKLRAALRASNPAARVSVATNGSLSGAGMAIQALANGADRVFIMGYSYRTSGTSPAGSIAPIARADAGKSLSWTLDLYAGKGIPAARLLLGLPYYGRSWHTTSGALHATTTSSAGVFIPSDDMAGIPAGTAIHTDAAEGSRWFAVQDPVTKAWTETYYDDGTTLRTKYTMAAHRGLAGAGIWTLGYDRGVSGYWDAIIGAFGTVRRAGADRYGTAAVIAADAFPAVVPVAYVASGATFPDALAAAAAAGHAKAPVLLVTASAIPSATLAQLKRLKPGRIVVAGGPSVVSDVVLSQLAALSAGGATRLAGPDRYGTAAAVSAATYPTGAPVAYITSGSGFADALSAAPAAARDGGPVLLTRWDILPAATRAELVRLAPARVVIVGSNAVVAPAIAEAIKKAIPGVAISRLAGTDRYGTSAAVAATFGTNVPMVYVASGAGFADALAAAAAAGAHGSPVLITVPTILPSVIRAQIVRLNPTRAVIAGGSSAVSDAVLAAVRLAVAAQ
jgi:putative cell wall-binding protein